MSGAETFLQASQKKQFHKKSSEIKNKKQSAWWTPLWKGLVFDAESCHRKRMGTALWLYLYLLTCTNRKSGIVHKKQITMAQETGYPLRTIQRHLKRLIRQGYISTEDSKRTHKIKITKWKLFNRTHQDDK